MKKWIMFFVIAVLVVIWIDKIHMEDSTYIKGDITEINKETGDMEIDIVVWSTTGDPDSPANDFGFNGTPTSQTVRVSHPENYDEGQKIDLRVNKDYEEAVWDLDRLKFEVVNVS
ncbi:hypothetical protein [Halobacillus salinus]|uniref:hypothetical protein n=1 Tax=Halobacillus salinus TaxID=192814 RepID=UPI0009A74EFF|nr:hypothetical protein [Halobacillus salinus]